MPLLITRYIGSAAIFALTTLKQYTSFVSLPLIVVDSYAGIYNRDTKVSLSFIFMGLALRPAVVATSSCSCRQSCWICIEHRLASSFSKLRSSTSNIPYGWPTSHKDCLQDAKSLCCQVPILVYTTFPTEPGNAKRRLEMMFVS